MGFVRRSLVTWKRTVSVRWGWRGEPQRSRLNNPEIYSDWVKGLGESKYRQRFDKFQFKGEQRSDSGLRWELKPKDGLFGFA